MAKCTTWNGKKLNNMNNKKKDKKNEKKQKTKCKHYLQYIYNSIKIIFKNIYIYIPYIWTKQNKSSCAYVTCSYIWITCITHTPTHTHTHMNIVENTLNNSYIHVQSIQNIHSHTHTHTHKVKCIIIEFIELKTKRTWEGWRRGKWWCY